MANLTLKPVNNTYVFSIYLHHDQPGHTPAAGRRTPAAGHRTPAADHRTPAAGRRTPAADHRTPAAGRHTPAAGCRTPAAGRRTPAAGRRTPAAGRRTPAAGRRTPAAGHRTPVVQVLAHAELQRETFPAGSQNRSLSLGARCTWDHETDLRSPSSFLSLSVSFSLLLLPLHTRALQEVTNEYTYMGTKLISNFLTATADCSSVALLSEVSSDFLS